MYKYYKPMNKDDSLLEKKHIVQWIIQRYIIRRYDQTEYGVSYMHIICRICIYSYPERIQIFDNNEKNYLHQTMSPSKCLL